MTSLVLWLTALVPLAYSAGPANITMAALGARFGFRNTLPFILGINVVVLASALAVGFGISRVLARSGAAFLYLQLAGALYMFYLAYKFARSARTSSADADLRPGFIDGVVLQAFNAKMFMVNVMMFSQFLDEHSPLGSQVLVLTLGLVCLTLSANALWGAGGAWLMRTFASERAVRRQGYVFGAMLAAVGAWMVYESLAA